MTYQVKVRIRGVAPLLQHTYPLVKPVDATPKKKMGEEDYTYEWMKAMYVTSQGVLYQPASHIEGAMVKAAVNFKIKGARGKTWKDATRAYVYVSPEQIPHLYPNTDEIVKAPAPELVHEPTDHLSVSVMRVKVQRAAVARSRLMINTGWELAFTIDCAEEQYAPDVCETILKEAGRAAGIGDFRPRYGRFEVVEFSVQ